MTASASPTSDAKATDPKALGLMQGFPPPADRTVAFADGSFRSFPQLRWAWSNLRQLVPTVAVWRGPAPASALPRAETDLGPLRFTAMDGQAMTFAEALPATYADGILVLHRGRIVYERYFGALEAHKPHICMSVTKSFVGTLAGALVADGLVDAEAQVTRYVPELGRSAFSDASVREVMDMTTGLRYTEVYTDPASGVWDLRRANGMAVRGPDYKGAATLYDFLVEQQKQGEHGTAFAYKTINTDVLAWILRRASGSSLADLLAERIWSQLGAEEDAYFTVDSVGTESGGGGLNTTLRDLARFGEMMRCLGAFNGRQIVPESAVADIMRGADPEKFRPAGYATLPGWSYRSMWWISHNEHGAYMARGVHGQSIYVDPRAEMVIVRFASHPQAGNVANDPVTLPAFMAVAKALMG